MNVDELNRLKKMYLYENEQFEKGFTPVAGTDEAGRGPLAGPVVSAVVVLPKLVNDSDFMELESLNDSKKLTPKKRKNIYNVLNNLPNVSIGIGIISEKTIDKINILKATQLSMRKAIANVDISFSFLLVDGMTIPGVDIPQKKIIDGDAKSLSIAAASVIAKVTRDNIMCEYDKKYPHYGFSKHKGYGTKEHYANLRKYGPCCLHRKSFSPISLMGEIGITDDI